MSNRLEINVSFWEGDRHTTANYTLKDIPMIWNHHMDKHINNVLRIAAQALVKHLFSNGVLWFDVNTLFASRREDNAADFSKLLEGRGRVSRHDPATSNYMARDWHAVYESEDHRHDG